MFRLAPRRLRVVLSLLIVIGLAVPAVAHNDVAETQPDGRVKGYVPPPKNLKLVGDHWTPYDPPTPPEGANVHVVVRGDTLWDLAGRFYNDNYLWPVIWDANRWVTYSHWIYPGDPLVIPPRPAVVGEGGLEGGTNAIVPVDTGPKDDVVEAQPGPTGPALFPAAAQFELLCSARLVDTFEPTALTIAGRDEPSKELQATGDIVYLNAGTEQGITAGTRYTVVRRRTDVMHPENGRFQAVYLQQLGTLRVIAVHSDSATAEIDQACDAIELGDSLVPHRETPVPMVEKIPLVQIATPYAGRLNGWVVTAGEPEETIAGAGDIVGIDLGSGAGLTAGDRILFWRDAENTSTRKVKAQGIVLSTTSAGSTVKLLESDEEVLIGDRAEAL